MVRSNSDGLPRATARPRPERRPTPTGDTGSTACRSCARHRASTPPGGPATEPTARRPPATGPTLFASVVLITVVAFQVLQGLAAVIEGDFYVVTPNNICELSLSGW